MGGRSNGFATTRLAILSALAAWSVGHPANAHHSAAAVFDMSNLVSITGTVSRLDLTNPHALIYLSVVHVDGAAEKWIIEMPGKLSLARRGWTDEQIAGVRGENFMRAWERARPNP